MQLFEGYSKKSWRSYWCYIENSTLHITKERDLRVNTDVVKNIDANIVIPLLNCNLSEFMHVKRKNLFQVQTTEGETHILGAGSAQEMKDWIDAIKEVSKPVAMLQEAVMTKSIADFEPLKLLGRGNFGKVHFLYYSRSFSAVKKKHNQSMLLKSLINSHGLKQ